MQNQTALILGSTGLVGSSCLQHLLESEAYSTVIALTRRETSIQHPKYRNLVTDFTNLEQVMAGIQPGHVFCAMGTTIAQAGSQEAFRRVDLEIPLQVASLAKAQGASVFVLVSSLGADPDSAVFYSRTKGEVEEGLKKLGFETLIILRPSILLGERKDMRIMESIGQLVAKSFSFLFAGPLRKYRGIPGEVVARAMVRSANRRGDKIRVIENPEIFKAAEE